MRNLPQFGRQRTGDGGRGRDAGTETEFGTAGMQFFTLVYDFLPTVPNSIYVLSAVYRLFLSVSGRAMRYWGTSATTVVVACAPAGVACRCPTRSVATL